MRPKPVTSISRVTNINPIVRVTKKAFDPEAVAKLEKGHQYTLKEIIRVLLED